MESVFYVLVSIGMLAVVVIVPGWFLARVSRFHQQQQRNIEESQATSAQATARTGVTLSALNTMTQK